MKLTPEREVAGLFGWGRIAGLTADFYAEVGCDGVTVLGILGEAPKLEGDESLAVATRFIKRAGRKQVIVGVSAPGFAQMRTLARASMDAGAAAVMIVVVVGGGNPARLPSSGFVPNSDSGV